MSVAAMDQDLYESFEPRSDSLFFRIGEQGVISFHGRNCNLRKRISTEQKLSLITDDAFFRLSSDCYVNVDRITAVENDCLYFEDHINEAKRIPLSRRQQEQILQKLAERKYAN